jgi:8-oxo-dGTP diphosphatase
MSWEFRLTVNAMQVVVGILINSQQEIFIAKRPPNKYKAGLWEFPGGKVELNESLFDALKRELEEEIGIQILSAEPWLVTQHDYGDRVVLLNTWLVTQFSGEAHGKEGQQIAWIPKSALNQFQFPDGNKEILEHLQNKK